MGEKEQKKSKVQRSEAKPSAKVHIPEKDARRLEQNLSQIDKMEEYSFGPSSGCSLLTALKHNHQANAGGTKEEVSRSEIQDVLSTNLDFVTQEPLEDLQVSLHDATVVTPLSLLLFGRHVKMDQEPSSDTDQGADTVSGGDTVFADDHIKLNCLAVTARLVQRLRRHLDELLLHKVAYPAPPDWTKSRKEGLVLESVVELLAAENENNWKF